MRQLTAFLRKEWMELLRSGKGFFLLIISLSFGIMNPAIAKLTPKMMEMMSESLAEAGMMVTEVKVDAITSWTQFYKNIPMALIIFALLFCGILTGEYQKGTLVNSVTKGMKRWKIFFSKWLVMILSWTVCYWLCFVITYGANAFFWDNSIAEHILFGAFCYYFLGVWVLSMLLCFSVYVNVGVLALLAAGGGYLASYVLSMIPALKHLMPTFLGEGYQLLAGAEQVQDYGSAMAVGGICIVVCLICGVLGLNKKQI